jgi:hypothetical protein
MMRILDQLRYPNDAIAAPSTQNLDCPNLLFRLCDIIKDSLTIPNRIITLSVPDGSVQNLCDRNGAWNKTTMIGQGA